MYGFDANFRGALGTIGTSRGKGSVAYVLIWFKSTIFSYYVPSYFVLA